MAKRYTHATSVSFDGDTPTAEFEVEVSYTVAWGSPERGRFAPVEGYDPGAGDLVEDIQIVTVDGKSSGWSHFITDETVGAEVIAHIEGNDAILEAMLEEAGQSEAEDAAAAAEHRADMRREMAWGDS